MTCQTIEKGQYCRPRPLGPPVWNPTMKGAARCKGWRPSAVVRFFAPMDMVQHLQAMESPSPWVKDDLAFHMKRAAALYLVGFCGSAGGCKPRCA